MPVLVPGVCGQATKSVNCLPVTCSAVCPKTYAASSFHALIAPALSIWTTATRIRWSVTGRSDVGRTGPAERMPTGRSGRSSWNQTCLRVGEYSTPQREARAAQSSRPRPFSRSGLPKSRPLLWSGTSRSG
ncbi:hypothetical protein GA0115253_106604 [Streptomyces sp. Termitarium-T10T-6]|nr:hypothetical protein GA0115253_106604 [Streptomyces sp. Termitarium-T10T-6]